MEAPGDTIIKCSATSDFRNILTSVGWTSRIIQPHFFEGRGHSRGIFTLWVYNMKSKPIKTAARGRFDQS